MAKPKVKIDDRSTPVSVPKTFQAFIKGVLKTFTRSTPK